MHLPVRNRRRNEIFSETIDNARLLLYNNTVNRITRPHKLKNMKKKEIISIIIITVVLAAILFGAIFLASRRENSNGNKALNLYRPIWQDKIIFEYKGASLDIGIHIVDPDIPDVSELPIDLSAYGIENFSKSALAVGNIDGIFLYFSYSYYEGLSIKCSFFRYNLLTAETSKIEFSSKFEVNSYFTFYAHGGYLYYFGWDNPEPSEDYNNTEKYLCCVPIVGGNEEVISKCKRKSRAENIIMVEKDTVITSEGLAIYGYDISDNVEYLVFMPPDNGYVIISLDNIFYQNGKLYFLAAKDLPSVAEAEEGFKDKWKSPDYYLISLDIGTRKWKKVVDDPVSCFCISDGRIYYVKKKYRILYLSEFPIAEKDIWTVTSDSSVRSCTLGGGDEQVHYTNEKISVNEIFSVKNGILCGKITATDETEYDYDNRLAVIDFSSGNITPFDMP